MTSPMDVADHSAANVPEYGSKQDPIAQIHDQQPDILEKADPETAAEDPYTVALKQYWEGVNANRNDFAAWEAMIRFTETPNGLPLSVETPTEYRTALRDAYDQFLAKFPLCFGYWKKYADDEFALEGAVAAEKVFERGVVSISNSVDLWTQFCAFKVENFGDNDEEIRNLFERGARCVGLDFLSHLFWDKYIEFEEARGAASNVLAILERVIRIPMHQYARFFEKYTHVYSERPLAEVIGAEELATIEAQVREAAGPDTPEADIDQQVRLKIHEIKSEIYTRTQAETLKRWPFESEIKRPYFHVRPMDDAQLANWVKYLDFEEAESLVKAEESVDGQEGKQSSDTDRVLVLYERCLVSCALYEDFWRRYANYLLSQQRPEEARAVYSRAFDTFVGPDKSSLRHSYAMLLESAGEIEEARAVYKNLLENIPDHVETIAHYAHFERRHSSKPFAAGEAIFRAALASETLDTKGKGFLYAQLANLAWRNLSKSSVAEARKIFKTGAEQAAESRYFWLNYLSFEMSQTGKTAEEHVQEVFDLIRTTSGLPVATIKEFGQRNLDFLIERGSSVQSYLQVEKAFSAPPPPPPPAESSRKREAEESPSPDTKRVKMDEHGDDQQQQYLPEYANQQAGF